jgi:uncharacterized protein YkwD
MSLRLGSAVPAFRLIKSCRCRGRLTFVTGFCTGESSEFAFKRSLGLTRFARIVTPRGRGVTTVKRLWHRVALGILGVTASAAAPLAVQADPLSAVQVLRQGGCGGTMPAAQSLHHVALLDRAAKQWALGRALAAALAQSGYETLSTQALHINGPDASAIKLIRRSGCSPVLDRSMREVGFYQLGEDTWIVLAAERMRPAAPKTTTAAAPTSEPAQSAPLPEYALQLVNDMRARGARCGDRAFGPAPPLRLSGALSEVAFGHAVDMAHHNYFEHDDLLGHTPADRVRAVGYSEKLVGENIAYGPTTTDEVLEGWLKSPGHCENMMDPRFAEMGIAYAPGQGSRKGLYWVQVLADPVRRDTPTHVANASP